MMSAEVMYELTDDERRYLQRLMADPGYTVLEKIIGGFVRTLEDSAQAASRIDPLRNRDAIAAAWAYVSIAERLQGGLREAVQFELSLLGIHSVNQSMTAAEKKARREAIVLGELDVEPEENDAR
jgi:hypothetical protein